MAAFVVVDAGSPGGINQDLAEDSRGSLGSAQDLYKRHQQRNDHRRQNLAESAHVVVEASAEHDARLNGVDMQLRVFTGERHRRDDAALLRRGIGVHPWLGGSAGLPFAALARLGGDVTAAAKAGSHSRFATREKTSPMWPLLR